MPNKDAVKLAAELLGKRDFSAKEMEERLVRRGYSLEESRAAVTRLIELGLLKISSGSREALLAAAREYLLKKGKALTPSSLRALGAYLARKGFEEELIEEYLTEAAAQLGAAPEEEAGDF